MIVFSVSPSFSTKANGKMGLVVREAKFLRAFNATRVNSTAFSLWRCNREFWVNQLSVIVTLPQISGGRPIRPGLLSRSRKQGLTGLISALR